MMEEITKKMNYKRDKNDISNCLIDDNVSYENTYVDDIKIKSFLFQKDMNDGGFQYTNETHFVKSLNDKIKTIIEEDETYYDDKIVDGKYNIQCVFDIFCDSFFLDEYKDENGKGVGEFWDYRIVIEDNNGNEYIPTYINNLGLMEEV